MLRNQISSSFLVYIIGLVSAGIELIFFLVAAVFWI